MFNKFFIPIIIIVSTLFSFAVFALGKSPAGKNNILAYNKEFFLPKQELNQSFPTKKNNPVKTYGANNNKNDLSLGELIILDKLFSSNSFILDNHNTTLGDLIILQSLFSDIKIFSEGEKNLADLFILDLLFSPDTDLLDKDKTSLGDIFILKQLFD